VTAAALIATFALATRGDDGDGPPTIFDHWHAQYDYVICGGEQQNAPFWATGVNTEGDGIIHIHPFTAQEEGRGARLVQWFEYGGGGLADDEVRLPGDNATYRNGDECPDGAEGVLQLSVTPAATGVEEELEDWSDYIPQDGDLVVIYFGPDINQ
jgi:hypothetical protein